MVSCGRAKGDASLVRIGLNDVPSSVMEQAVHPFRRDPVVAEERVALGQVAVRRDRRRTPLVALPNDTIEAHRFVALQRAKTEVIDNE